MAAKSGHSFSRFTEQARQVLICAQDEAVRLRHIDIAPEHLVLGMIKVDRCTAIQILSQFEMPLFLLKSEIESRCVNREDELPEELPINTQTKRVIELTVHEAKAMKHDHIGTGHLLLGIAREPEEPLMTVFAAGNVTADALRPFVQKSATTTPYWATRVLKRMNREFAPRERL